jgi:hypothetical protein
MEIELVNIITWVAGFAVTTLVGFAFRLLNKNADKQERERAAADARHDALQAQFVMFLTQLPEKYVAKSDYHAGIEDIKLMLRDLTSYVHGRANV